MRATRRVITIVALALLSAAWIATAGAEDPDRSFTFRLDTPPVEFRPQEDGFTELNVEGFHTRLSEVGAPDVPSRVVLVAIPPGATPRLSVRPTGKGIERAFTPRPVLPAVARELREVVEHETMVYITRLRKPEREPPRLVEGVFVSPS